MNTVTAQPLLAPHVTNNDQHTSRAMIETSFHEFFQVFAAPLNKADASSEIPPSESRSIKENKNGGSQIDKNDEQEVNHSRELRNIDVLSNKDDNLFDQRALNSKSMSSTYSNSPPKQQPVSGKFENKSQLSNLDAGNFLDDSAFVGKGRDFIKKMEGRHFGDTLTKRTSISGERMAGYRQGIITSNTILYSKTSHNEETEICKNSNQENSRNVSKEFVNVESKASGWNVGVDTDQAQKLPTVFSLLNEYKLTKKSENPLGIRESSKSSEVNLGHDQFTPKDSGKAVEKGRYKGHNYIATPPLMDKTHHPQVFPELESASKMNPNSSRPATCLSNVDDDEIFQKGGHKLGATTENTSFTSIRSSASFEHLSETAEARSSISSRKQETNFLPSVGPSHVLSLRSTGDNFGLVVTRSEEIIQPSTVAPGSAAQIVGKPEAGIYVQGTGALQNWGLHESPQLPHPKLQEPSPLSGGINSPGKQTGLDTQFPKSSLDREVAHQTTDLVKNNIFPDQEELLTSHHQNRILAPREAEISSTDTSRLANFRHNFTQQVLNVSGTMESGQVELRLSPDELGTVRIHLTRHENSIALLLSAERPETLDLFRRNIGSLSSDLRDLGFEDVEMTFLQDQQPEQEGSEFAFQDVDGPAISDPPDPDDQLQKSQHTELDIRI